MGKEKVLSVFDRQATLNRLKENIYDVIIIGGGITGAGIALDCASRGMKVALIEKEDYAWGTSSRSTKLIHGGLRYLKQLEINLVREVGRERAILYKNAPHIVKSENMLLPIIKKGSLGKFSTAFGLSVYDRLAGVEEKERRKMLSKEQVKKAEPLLDENNLLGGAIYREYRTDDARLTIEVLKTAAYFGADCINYVKAIGFEYKDGRAMAVKIQDKKGDSSFFIKGRYIVNACGPWVDELRKADPGSIKGKRLHLTKGVHLVVSKERFPVKQSLYFDVPGGRMIFVIPRGNTTYIGTTDTNYQEETDRPLTSREDVSYLLAGVNRLFPSVHLTEKDIQSTWSGLRPLIHQEGKSPSELSRKDEVFIAPSGIISIAGGKLTGFRKMAEKVTELIMNKLYEEEVMAYQEGFTEKIILSGGDFKKELMEDYQMRLIEESKLAGYAAEDIAALMEKYGSNTEKVIEQAYLLNDEIADRHTRLLTAELKYCILEEGVTDLNDFLIRRTGKLYFERPSLEKVYPILEEQISKILGWDKLTRDEMHLKFKAAFKEVMEFN